MLPNSDNFRDCDAWRKEGLRMNTTSNEACKLYDVVLSQYVGWYENENYGGFESSIEKMVRADDNFVLGRVLKLGIELIGSSSYLSNKCYFNSINDLIKISSKKDVSLSKRELDHIEAIKNLYDGNVNIACDYWENILVECPTDLMALKFAHDSYFYTGSHVQMRDSVARVLPRWKPTLSMYSYLHGMHSFGLAQTNYFVEAERAAKKSLELNKRDAWATHTLCHVFEYKNEYDKGIRFLMETEGDWSKCSFIATHNYWHLSLYHLERNEHEQALKIFDENISAYLNANRTLDLVDLASLLYRLKLDCTQVSLNERWSKLKEVFESRVKDHAYTFNDFHVLMIFNACNDTSKKEMFYESLENYLNEKNEQFCVQIDSCNNIVKNLNEINYLKGINKKYASDIFDSICHFDKGEFSQVVEKLYPIRYGEFKNIFHFKKILLNI
jgi:hypothetical protein